MSSRFASGLKTAAKWAMFAAVLFFVARALVVRFSDVSWGEIRLDGYRAAAAAGCLLVAAVLNALTFHLLLRSVFSRFRLREIFALTSIAQLGKYVPGKAASVAGLVWMLVRRGAPVQVATGVVFIRTGLQVTVGLMVAAPLTLWEPVRTLLPMAYLWCPLIVLAGAICLHPRVFGGAGNFILRKLKRQPIGVMPRLRDYAAPVVTTLLQWAMLGMGMFFLCNSVADVPFSRAFLFPPAVALAQTLGFLVVFAPAGLGVREGIYLVILTPLVGANNAAVLTVAFRLLQTLTEVSLAGLGAGILAIGRRGSTGVPPV